MIYFTAVKYDCDDCKACLYWVGDAENVYGESFVIFWDDQFTVKYSK